MSSPARPRSKTEGSEQSRRSPPRRPRAASAGDRMDYRLSRPTWDDRHHLLFSRENATCPLGQRDYFDRPRDLRIVVPDGHDGISHPFDLRPSLHWLKYTESPKMQRTRSLSSTRSGSPSKSGHQSEASSPTRGRGGSQSMDTTQDSIQQAPKTPTKASSVPSLRATAATNPAGSTTSSPEKAAVFNRHGGGVGSPYGSPTKPIFQKSASWYLNPERASPEQRRSDKYVHLGYSEKHGTRKLPSTGEDVPWNNRWHLNPSMLGQEIHPNYREYFDNPSRMYTSTTEDWRHMYGDNCEIINFRTPGFPCVNPVYGWHSLRLQKGILKKANAARNTPLPAQTL